MGMRLALSLTLLLAVGIPSVGAQTSRDILVKPTAPASAPASSTSPRASFYTNSWAIVIGVNAYQKGLPRLNYAVADARAVAEALPALGFPRRNIRLLVDSEATRARIESVLYREFAAKVGPEDRVLIYFAGHGETIAIRGGEEGYFLPVDADRDALPATAILMEDMRRIGKRLRAKHVLFVMDACFSGFSLGRDIAPRAVTDSYLESVLREPVVQVLTAGRKGERSLEEGGHGLFTRRFLEGVRGLADADDRGLVTVSQLAAWLEPRVARDSDGRMHPQYSKLEGEGQFVFLRPSAQVVMAARAPAAVAAPAARSDGRLTREQQKVVDDAVALGLFFEARGDVDRAGREYALALEVDPERPEARQGLSRVRAPGQRQR
jgi:uncharacterized caspase-like protein